MFAVDYPSYKFYISLITCAVTRAVHLELTDTLSVPDCLLAFRRFSARRGFPSVIYSDNAKTFVSVSNKFLSFYGSSSPEWIFIAPKSPWWGGWWERLVRSVKLALRKTLGKKCLTKCELETTLMEAESCINSRPLTYVDEDPNVANPLTPSHFLIGRLPNFQPDCSNVSCDSSKNDLTEREIIRVNQLNKFWNVWSNDYLKNLPPIINKFKSKCNLKIGSLVLVREDNFPRMYWSLGIIVDTHPGNDGLVRSVKICTSQGIICRPIQLVHDLEVYTN